MNVATQSAQVKFVCDAGFGFLDGKIGRVYFHKAGYRVPALRTSPEPHLTLVKSETAARPQPGEWITYVEGKNEKSICAIEWCLRSDWNEADYQLKHLPRFRLAYRYIQRSAPKGDSTVKGWIETETVREDIYDPTFNVETITILLDYRGNEMLNRGQFQLQIARNGDNWEVVPNEKINEKLPNYARFFSDQSLWEREVDQERQRRVA